MGSLESDKEASPATGELDVTAKQESGEHEVTGAGRTVHYAPTRGRPSSWVAVIIMILAFTVGGFGIVFWNWWVAGVSAGVFAVAFLGALVGGIMNDVH